jgi:hypothetical protein
MVLYEVRIKYFVAFSLMKWSSIKLYNTFFYSLLQHPGLFALLPCFIVQYAFFWILTPCSLVGGNKSLSPLSSHTDDD